MKHGRVIFLINLIQDINIVRPLAYLTAVHLRRSPEFFVSNAFYKRDTSGMWRTELERLVQASGGNLFVYDSGASAVQGLFAGSGVIVAASESDLGAHRLTHEVFLSAPSGYVKITLQHGFECVGFLHNRAHDAAHGLTVGSAADILAGWRPAHLQTALPLDGRDRYVNVGPATAIAVPNLLRATVQEAEGLICENLHSARFSQKGELRDVFMEALSGFNDGLADSGAQAALRPHPAGQFSQRGDKPLPSHMVLANAPMYRLALGSFRYGISPPSSVLIDLVLAGVPTAVWRDAGGGMNSSHYDGLAEVSSAADWIRFRMAALSDPTALLERQNDFLARTELLTDGEQVTSNFLSLLASASTPLTSARTRRRRFLFVANGFLPTLDIYFLSPLEALAKAGVVQLNTLFEADIVKMKPGKDQDFEAFDRYLEESEAEVIIFCRYSGAGVEEMLRAARRRGVSTIFHIDDDLLNVPAEIGLAKQKFHSAPERLAAVTTLLKETDLVYCSTRRLADRFRDLGFDRQYLMGDIQASGPVVKRAELRPTRTIGYMGFDHANDLEMVLPAIIMTLDRHPTVRFEIMGSIPKPPALDRFGERVSTRPPIRDFALFRAAFAETGWDVGICPLAATEFNQMKANIKWWEYTVIGAAVIASRDTLYDECCADGCGILASTIEDWVDALDSLCSDFGARYDLVANAQSCVDEKYSHDKMAHQALEAVRLAHLAASPATG